MFDKFCSLFSVELFVIEGVCLPLLIAMRSNSTETLQSIYTKAYASIFNVDRVLKILSSKLTSGTNMSKSKINAIAINGRIFAVFTIVLLLALPRYPIALDVKMPNIAKRGMMQRLVDQLKFVAINISPVVYALYV